MDKETYTRNLLVLMQLDSEHLFNSVRDRFTEYIKIFALKRTREHFAEIFRTRYLAVPMLELAHCSEDVIIALDTFYSKVSDMHWYLMSTEDMPAMVEDTTKQYIREMTSLFDTLKLYLKG